MTSKLITKIKNRPSYYYFDKALKDDKTITVKYCLFGSLVNIASGLLLFPAAPFAAVPFIQGHLSDIQIYKDIKKVSKDTRKEVLNKAKENR